MEVFVDGSGESLVDDKMYFQEENVEMNLSENELLELCKEKISEMCLVEILFDEFVEDLMEFMKGEDKNSVCYQSSESNDEIVLKYVEEEFDEKG